MGYIYAQLNDDDYCIGVSFLSNEVIYSDMIAIDVFDTLYIRRKYDRVNGVWTNEYLEKPSEIE